MLWPTISPDGSQIAYAVQSPDDGSNDLCFSAAVGSNHQRLVEHGLFYAVDALVFSPDGQKVLFSLTQIYDTGLFGDSSPDGAWLGYMSQSGVYIMAPDSSLLTRLRNDSLTGTMNWIP